MDSFLFYANWLLEEQIQTLEETFTPSPTDIPTKVVEQSRQQQHDDCEAKKLEEWWQNQRKKIRPLDPSYFAFTYFASDKRK